MYPDSLINQFPSKMISNQVWVCVVPKEEAVTRIMERDSKSREEAERRVASQLSNAERVAQASRRRNSSQSSFKKQSDSLNHFSGKQKKAAANHLFIN